MQQKEYTMRKSVYYMSLALLSISLTGCQDKSSTDPAVSSTTASPSSVVAVSSVVSDLDLTDDTQPELSKITPVEVFSNDTLTVSTDSLDSDSDNTYLFLNLENKSQKDLYLVCEAASINGIILDCNANMEIAAGEKLCTPLSFTNTDLNTAGIHTVASLTFKLSVYDMESSEELFETDTVNVSTDKADGFVQDLNLDGQQLYDANNIQLIAKGATLDSDNSPVVVIFAVNHSAKDISLSGEIVGKSADTCETSYSYEIPAGMAALTYLSYYDELGDVVEDIKGIPVVLTLMDTSDWSDIGKTEALSFNSSIIDAYLHADDTDEDTEKENVVSYSGEDAADAIPQSSSTIDDAAADGEGTLPEDTDADGDYVGMDEHEGDYLSEDDY